MVKKKPKLQSSDPSAESGDSSEGSSKPKTVAFKNAAFVASRANTNKKSKGWKTLKQIMAIDKPHLSSGITYGALDLPASSRPREKFSDLSGIVANYTDPQTKLHYCDADEFTQVRLLDQDVVNGYLELRKVPV